MKRLFDLARPALFSLDAERAHGLSIAALRTGVPVCRPAPHEPSLETRLLGLTFPNPVGMAAGFDKNGEVPDALLSLGFGFAEVGTVTPRPQTGNPRPRIFRLPEDEAVINRLGFNNQGHARVHRRLAARAGASGIVGVNIGANKDSADRVGDYAQGVRLFAGIASYFTVNISSPNTPGLRDLQARESLDTLLGTLAAARGASAAPILLKIAPDLADPELEDIAGAVLDHGIDGVIVSNTTLSRADLTSRMASETGGVSGRPLFERSTIVLARMRRLVGREMVLVGVGGVDSAETALEKIRAGADLVQLYTGMIYRGPALAGEIIRGLSTHMRREGLAAIHDIRDAHCHAWAGRRLD